MRSAFFNTLAKYVLGLTVLAIVVWRHWHTTPAGPDTPEMPGLKDVLSKPIQWRSFALAFALLAPAVLLTFVRWFVLVRALDLPNSFGSILKLALYGYFFNTLLPGSIGGDLVKAGALAGKQERSMAAVASILFDRAVGLGGLALLMVISGGVYYLLGDPMLTTKPELMHVLRTTAIATVVAALGWYLLKFIPAQRAERFATRLERLPVVGHFASELWRSGLMYRAKPKAVALAVGMTLLVHVFNITSFDQAARVFESDPGKLPTLAEHFVIVPVGLTMKAFFPSPGGVGGGEFIYGVLYRMTGRSETMGVSASFATLVVTILMAACAFVATHFLGKKRISHG